MQTKLYKRTIYQQIQPYLHTGDIIVIHGARQTGKTSLLKIIMNDLSAHDYVYFDLEDSRYLEICEEGIENTLTYLRQKGILKNQKRFYLLIDEIQYLSNPSSFLKYTHDHYPQIKLIISGSSSFEIKSKFKDSLVGRTVNFEIFPLSFEEYIDFKEKQIDLKNELTIPVLLKETKELYREYVLFGGYPKIALTDSKEQKETYLQQIIDTYVKKDIRDLAKIRNITKFNKLVHILASQGGQLLNISELANTSGLARKTVEEYLFILENTYVIKLVYPFSRNLRSELFKTPKIFFYDNGLMNMLLYKTLPVEITGNTFETSVFSEFVKFLRADQINFWRTQDKKEIDYIISKKDLVIPFEVKLNAASLKMTALNYFNQKYNPKELVCVRFLGNIPKARSAVRLIYPWELKRYINLL